MVADRQFATSALAFLFFAEGQRAWFASLFGLTYDAVFPELLVIPALLAVLPLLALVTPMLPLARLVDRDGAVGIALIALAVFRIPLTFPDFALRVVSATLVVGAGALFLTWAVGYIEGRALAAGAVAGLVVDQLLRLAGTSWDLSLRPEWLPVQVVLSLALLYLVVAPARAGAPASVRAKDEDGRDSVGGGAGAKGGELERRRGGLRLRGALALGGLLFLDLHVLGLPPVLARWTGVSYEFAVMAVSAGGAVALIGALVGRGPVRNRMLALALVVLLGAGLALGPWIEGEVGALLLAGGHGAALLLVARALNPASGRRGRWVVTAGMGTFATLTALYTATYFHAFLLPVLDGAAPYVFTGAVILVAASFVLLPQPPASPRKIPILVGVALGGAVLAAAAGLLVALTPAPAVVPAAAASGSGPGAPGAAVRVATYNLHYGYDEGWRFDPEAIARTIGSVDPDMVALQEVPVGLPTSYGVDFPLWLSRRLALPAFFAPNVNGLQGEALLARLPIRGVRAVPLPPDDGDPKQLLHLSAILGGRNVEVYALHLSVHEDERMAQIAAALDSMSPGRAVLLGDLNAEPGTHVARSVAAAGFVDAFEAAGVEGPGTWPALEPQMRIDWIWLRGVEALSATVLSDAPSDHRLVSATLKVAPPGGS